MRVQWSYRYDLDRIAELDIIAIVSPTLNAMTQRRDDDDAITIARLCDNDDAMTS